ncbi:MAG: 4Fe-4S dicluster domain-containing protein, partial [Candidatus Thorarchaeota archaeon]
MVPEYKIFSRGYEFRNFEGQPEDKLIQIEIPRSVTIPLRQGFGNEVAPLVEPDQKVAAGEIIGRDDESVSSPVHSSVNGRVVRIERIDYLGRETGVIFIESDRARDWKRLKGYSSKWEDLSPERIDELIYLSGTSSSGRAGIPTRFNSSVIASDEVESVIIQGVDSEVHNLSLDVLLQSGRLLHFIEGLKILKKVMARARFHLALRRSQKSLLGEVSQSLLTENSINFFTVPAKYPVYYDEVLTPLLLGGGFPYGYSAANIGVIVLDIQAVLHIYEAVVEGKPLIDRMVALCGPGLSERPHVQLRVGTSLEHVIEGKVRTDKELRFVRNSLLTGESLPDLSLPIDRTSTTITALPEQTEREFLSFARPGFRKDSYSRTCLSILFKKDSKMFQKSCGTNVHGERRPCIFCTFCEEVCPVAIIPHLLYHHIEKDIIDETLLKYKISNCIECDLCSYVCPSKIPLARRIREAKAKLVDEGFKYPVP